MTRQRPVLASGNGLHWSCLLALGVLSLAWPVWAQHAPLSATGGQPGNGPEPIVSVWTAAGPNMASPAAESAPAAAPGPPRIILAHRIDPNTEPKTILAEPKDLNTEAGINGPPRPLFPWLHDPQSCAIWALPILR